MLRVATAPRANWQKTVEAQGLTFHTLGGEPYWDESAYYLFEASEIDAIEAATYQLDAMCLQAVEHVLSEDRLDEFDIPEEYHAFVRRSWDVDEQTIYGRFDLSFDGQGPPKLLEYNADTPTALLEAAVIQWFWSKDLLAGLPAGSAAVRSIQQHPRAADRSLDADQARVWRPCRVHRHGRLARRLDDGHVSPRYRHAGRHQDRNRWPCAGSGGTPVAAPFTDLRERPLPLIFKLYPWEWMVREKFGPHLLETPTRWLEPPWKMILSNKAILPVLYELFPSSPYLLRSEVAPWGDTYVVKPAYSREGSNVSIVVDGETVAETGGEYTDGPHIYQEFHPLPDFGGRHPVVGSWIVNGHACGRGIREDGGLITRNTSRFLPHLMRKAAWIKPPARGASKSGSSGSEGDPRWDRWLDR